FVYVLTPAPAPSALFPSTTLFRSYVGAAIRRAPARRITLQSTCPPATQRSASDRRRTASGPPALPSTAPVCPSSAQLRSSTAASDRKSTRLNSSHVKTSYAGFCLK